MFVLSFYRRVEAEVKKIQTNLCYNGFLLLDSLGFFWTLFKAEDFGERQWFSTSAQNGLARPHIGHRQRKVAGWISCIVTNIAEDSRGSQLLPSHAQLPVGENVGMLQTPVTYTPEGCLTPPNTWSEIPMQVLPGPACSPSYLWETKKVLDMNMVSDCCTSSRSTSAMVHCSKRGSSSFLSPSNMPYTASIPSAKLPSARDDTHSLLEKHTSTVNISEDYSPQNHGHQTPCCECCSCRAAKPLSLCSLSHEMYSCIPFLELPDPPAPHSGEANKHSQQEKGWEAKCKSPRISMKIEGKDNVDAL